VGRAGMMYRDLLPCRLGWFLQMSQCMVGLGRERFEVKIRVIAMAIVQSEVRVKENNTTNVTTTGTITAAAAHDYS
jgi:hypothetical protein